MAISRGARSLARRDRLQRVEGEDEVLAEVEGKKYRRPSTALARCAWGRRAPPRPRRTAPGAPPGTGHTARAERVHGVTHPPARPGAFDREPPKAADGHGHRLRHPPCGVVDSDPLPLPRMVLNSCRSASNSGRRRNWQEPQQCLAPKRPTPGTAKLLQPPRQSRGASQRR